MGIYVSSTNPLITIDILREGATTVLMQHVTNVPAFVQSVPESAWATGCDWAPTLRIPIPDSWPSGIYEAKFTGTTFSGSYAIFTVLENDPGSTGSLLFQSSTTTWQAYNNWGGKSLYPHNSTNAERAYVASYKRPYVAWSGRGQFPDWELQFVRWLEGAGFGVEYCTNVDTHARPDLQSHYELFMSIGHDEYWSKEARDAIEGRLAARKNVAIFSGNTCWWQIRFSAGLDRLICYKDKNLDPLTGVDDSRVTVHWFEPPTNRPENIVTGVSWRHGGYVNAQGWLPASEGYGDYTAYRTNHWVYDGTGLSDGEEFGFATTIVGFETDGALFSWKNGIPLVTGVDGAPISYKILGLSPASTGYATMGIFKRGGTLFNAATTDWSHGLATDAIVDRITRNVIEALAGITPTLPSNEPPVILAPDELASAPGEPVLVPIESMDPELGTLAFDALDLPPGLEADSTTGAISGVVPLWGARALPYTVTLRGWDDASPPETTAVTWEWRINGVVGVGDHEPEIPARLLHTFPNPIRRGAHVRYTLADPAAVRIDLWDLQGRKVREIEPSSIQSAGYHEASWDGKDERGLPLASGVYILGLEAGSFHQSERVIVLH